MSGDVKTRINSNESTALQKNLAEIDYIQLVSNSNDIYDIKRIITEIEVYEDLIRPAISATIKIADDKCFLDMLPITGFETIRIKFKSMNYKPKDIFDGYVKEFIIVRLRNIIQEKEDLKTYTLDLVTKDALEDMRLKITKSYRNMKASDIVKELLTSKEPYGLGLPLTGRKEEYDRKSITIEPTKFDDSVIGTYKSPFEMITWLASRSIGEYINTKGKQVSANYFFFENKRGYNFTPIEKLSYADPKGTFLYGLRDNVEKHREIMYSNNGVKKDLIHELGFPENYNIVQNFRNGMYSNRVLSYNINTGDINDIKSNYQEYFADYDNMSGGQKLLPENMIDRVINQNDACLKAIPTCPVLYDDMPSEITLPEQYVMNRLVYRQILNNNRIHLTINANSLYTVGDIVNIEIYDTKMVQDGNGVQKQVDLNKFYSGKYLITAVRHIITRTSYLMRIEVIRDNVENLMGIKL